MTAALLFTAAVGAGVLGFLNDDPTLATAAGVVATLASGFGAYRLWRWSKQISEQDARMREWHFRPGYLVALLIAFFFLAMMFIDVGRFDIAAWTLPAALVFIVCAMSRGRLQEFLNTLLFPTQTPRRQD